MTELQPIPVTVLTGFLGAGKTTLLRHLLKAEHGLKIAVIENEFSDAGIDSQLLGTDPVQIMTLSNGCVCCTIHTDLTKALYLLLERLDCGEIAFDRLVIECTGLADPAPVAQTFIDEELRERYILDGIITLVDAAHADTHLTQTIAQAQIGFADRLLVSKRDLVDDAAFDALSARLTRINRRAAIRTVDHGKWPNCSTYAASPQRRPRRRHDPAPADPGRKIQRPYHQSGAAQRKTAEPGPSQRVHERTARRPRQTTAALQGRAQHRRRAAQDGVSGRAQTVRLRLGYRVGRRRAARKRDRVHCR